VSATVSAIPAGAANMADLLDAWRTVINGKRDGASYVKQADTSRASTTTFANDPDLIAPVVAGGIYRFVFHAGVTAPATPQWKTQFSAPSGSTLRGGIFFNNGATGAPLGSTHSVSGMSGTDFYYQQIGLLIVGATAGNFAEQWAQVASNASNCTLLKGSCLILERLV
jgi:hypothetical protein